MLRPRGSPDPDREEVADVERRRAEGREALSQVVTLAADSVQRPKPVHAVLQGASPLKSKFWAQSSDPDLTDSEDEDPSTPDFIDQATRAGFTLDQLCKAEKALESGNSNPCSSDVRLAKSIVSKLVQNKYSGAPWKGPLPPPRVSPPRTLGDVISKAAYRCSPAVNMRSSYSFDVLSESRSMNAAGTDILKNFELPDPNSKEQVTDFPPLSPARVTDLSVHGDGGSTTGSKQIDKVFLGPGKFFRPTKGLCALFARTGTRLRFRKPPPAPPVPSHATRPRSFAEVVSGGRRMAAPGNGGFGRGGRGRGSFDPGFQPGFNPGRGGHGGGHGYAPHRGRNNFNGYNNHGARNSGAHHYYGGSRRFVADRGNGRRRGRDGWHNAYPNPTFPAPQHPQGGFGGAEGFHHYGDYQYQFGGQYQHGGAPQLQHVGGHPQHGGALQQPAGHGASHPGDMRPANAASTVGHQVTNLNQPAHGGSAHLAATQGHLAQGGRLNSKVLPSAREGSVAMFFTVHTSHHLSGRVRHFKRQEQHKEAE